jgi:hypothetical protein
MQNSSHNKRAQGANYLKVGNYSNSGLTLGFWDLIFTLKNMMDFVS